MRQTQSRPRHRALMLAIFGVSSLVAIGPMAAAQGVLEEVVVTAQKREENVAEVPVAVSVLSGDVVQDSFLNNMEDIQQFVPSVSIRQGNTTRNQALTVRGIGTISFSIAAEPSVSTVVDNVVLGRSGQAFADLYDLDRVEVLRGPQGTLFGKNASAGVVNITTKRPTEELSGYIDTQFYQDNEYILRGKIAGPINDQLRGSLVVMDASFDGFIQNVFNNETVNGYDKRGLRGMLEYDVDDNTNVLFIFEDYSANNDCCADLELRPSGRNPDSEAAPFGTGLDLDQRLIDHDFETRTLDDHTAASIQIEKQIGELTLTSITAFRQWDNTEFREGDFTSIAGDSTQPVFGVPFQLHDIGPQEWRQFSQELRLSSPVGEAFDYQVGLFYWNIDSERNFTRDASCQNNNGQLNAAITNHLQLTLDQPNATQADVDAFIANNGITCNANDIVSATGFMDTEFLNYALFGQGNYHFNDQWSMLFGLRFTSDEVSFNHNRRNNDEFGRRGVGVRPRFSDGNNQFDTNLSGSTDDQNLAGKLGVQWDFADNAMAYATYSQGYKGPAFNVFYNMDDDDVNPINAEESDSFELGTKVTWDTGYIAVTYFNTEIENFQANDFDDSDGTTITGFTNGGDVESTGFEIDFIWRPTEALSFSGGAAFIDAESTTGAPLPFSPDVRFSLVSAYDWSLANGATLRLNGNYVYSDDKLSGNIGQTAEVPFLLPDFGLLNASLAYISEDERFTVSLIGKNLTDESFATTFAGDGFRYTVPRDADRYFGVSVRLNY